MKILYIFENSKQQFSKFRQRLAKYLNFDKEEFLTGFPITIELNKSGFTAAYFRQPLGRPNATFSNVEGKCSNLEIYLTECCSVELRAS